MKVGFIGLGEIGGPMAANMLANGLSVSVYARRPEVADRFAGLGADIAESPSAVGRDADVVGLCPYTDEQVQQLALADPELLQSMRPGAVLVLHTTGRPNTARQLAAKAAGNGIDVLDAPVSGTVKDVTEGHITLLVGGTVAALARARPAMACYADPIIHLGPVGSGQAAKLVNNSLLGANVKLLTDAERIARSLGLAPGALAAALTHASGGSRVAQVAVDMGSIEEMTEYLRPYVYKDVTVALEVASEMGVDLGLVEQVLRYGGSI